MNVSLYPTFVSSELNIECFHGSENNPIDQQVTKSYMTHESDRRTGTAQLQA